MCPGSSLAFVACCTVYKKKAGPEEEPGNETGEEPGNKAWDSLGMRLGRSPGMRLGRSLRMRLGRTYTNKAIKGT